MEIYKGTFIEIKSTQKSKQRLKLMLEKINDLQVYYNLTSNIEKNYIRNECRYFRFYVI